MQGRALSLGTIRFTTELLDTFSDASWDRNPLHLSEDHARRTPFGARVVFGVLSGLAALAELPSRSERAVASLQFDFVGAAAVGVDYAIRVAEADPDRATAFVLDGQRPLLNAGVRLRPGPGSSPAAPAASAAPARTEPAELTADDMHEGMSARGTYAPSWEALRRLAMLLRVGPPYADPMTLAVLLWSSYLVGMELPGRRALFASLSVDYHGEPATTGPFHYEARVTGTTPRGARRIMAELDAGGQRIAGATLDVVVREDPPVVCVADVERHVGRGEALRGKTALVTGGSRGLGAALVQALALRGATVIATYLHSDDEAARIRGALADAPGTVHFVRGDAADPDFWDATGAMITREHGRLDMLVCNASPPILPLWLEAPAVGRVNDFVARTVAMVSCPAAALLPLLQPSNGWLALVSSAHVDAMPAELPHYNAAKVATEALVRTAVHGHRKVSGLIARPPKLLTDQTNTPLAKRGALPVELAAAVITARLAGPTCPGTIDVLTVFR